MVYTFFDAYVHSPLKCPLGGLGVFRCIRYLGAVRSNEVTAGLRARTRLEAVQLTFRISSNPSIDTHPVVQVDFYHQMHSIRLQKPA